MTPVLSLADLIQQTAEFVTPDDIYVLIAAGRLYVDLYAEPLVEPAQVRVFQDRDAAIRHEAPPDDRPASVPLQSIHSGATLMWDDRIWKVINVGNRLVSLLGENGTLVEVPQAAVESLVREGRMAQPVAERQGHHKLPDQLLRASEDDLKVANQRADIVRRHLSGASPLDGQRISARTLRRWVSRYRAAESQWGAGYLGLLPQTSQRGNSTRRLQEQSLRLMDEIIESEYESVKQKSRIACWAILKETCKQQSVPTPSYTSFCSAVRNRNRFKQTLKRQGPRAAYQHGPFHMELDLKTPRHGDRPFEICHFDHTQLDIELTDTAGTHQLGRPWMTLLIDAFSRRILALHVDFEEPSYRSCMMVVRECVRRHNRLPQCLVVDWGAEFRSTYFESLLARYECTKKARPPAKARFGSLVERAFGTTNTQFVHNLVGNTQIVRNLRQVTKSVNPKELAIWRMAPFMERLWEYAYDIYDTNVHPALGESPKDAYERGFQNSGSRLHRLIPYDHDFMIATLPSTPRGTAMVSPGRGVKINYIFYWCDGMDDPKIRSQQIPVRFDPFDLGTAYAFIAGQWVQCHSDHYRTFQGRSQKELLVASKELHAQNRERGSRFQLTASKLAQAFQSIDLQESLLLQRLRTRETQAVRSRTPPPEERQDSQVADRITDSLVFGEPISLDGQVFERF
jgi:transposase InsO family protein